MSESSEELKRIANALEEILRLVKEDQERSRKYMEDRKDDSPCVCRRRDSGHQQL